MFAFVVFLLLYCVCVAWVAWHVSEVFGQGSLQWGNRRANKAFYDMTRADIEQGAASPPVGYVPESLFYRSWGLSLDARGKAAQARKEFLVRFNAQMKED